MNEKVTCGELYNQGLDHFCHTEVERLAFLAGTVTGQAEKVYLGACVAAMFRPSDDNLFVLMPIVLNVMYRYGLSLNIINEELWISRPENAKSVATLGNFTPNSSFWHRVRGKLCGIPELEIDEKYHERKGYNEPCDVLHNQQEPVDEHRRIPG